LDRRGFGPTPMTPTLSRPFAPGFLAAPAAVFSWAAKSCSAYQPGSPAALSPASDCRMNPRRGRVPRRDMTSPLRWVGVGEDRGKDRAGCMIHGGLRAGKTETASARRPRDGRPGVFLSTAMTRLSLTIAALLVLSPLARAGLHYSGETTAELPSRWRGFLIDHRSLR